MDQNYFLEKLLIEMLIFQLMAIRKILSINIDKKKILNRPLKKIASVLMIKKK